MSQSPYNDVFISYSRKDNEFAKKFVNALYKDVQNIWVDWEDIEIGEDWWERICGGIESADNFVFIITEDNFDILYQTKDIDTYKTFFERNYP